MRDKTCKECKSKFNPKNYWQKFCDIHCKQISWNKAQKLKKQRKQEDNRPYNEE